MLPLERAKNQFNHKHVLIFGLGLLGGASGDVKFFLNLGADVRATDQRDAQTLQTTITALKSYPVEYSLGGHYSRDIEWADYIIRNPAVPITHPLLMQAKMLGKPVIMRTSLFASLSNIPIVGVTGTRGKTTTTLMINHLLKQHTSMEVILGGNLAGISDLELITRIHEPEKTVAVMELSSWQLQGFAADGKSPHVAVITNLYPDHLNRYSSLEEYYLDKKAILDHQKEDDISILNDDQPEFHQWCTQLRSSVVWYSANDLPKDFQLSVPGLHNRYNAAAALRVARYYGIPDQLSLKSLTGFRGVPYRLEPIAIKNGVTYINDTTATTPVATIMALKTITGPVIAILGGYDKNLPLEELADALARIKALVLLPGSGTDRLKPLLASARILTEAGSMSDAVAAAVRSAALNDTVLLSPGFASFGMFNNEFDRGDQFNQCVNQL